MSAARKVLERLLRRAESARQRGADEHVSLPMTSASGAAEYISLQSLDELERFHGEIAVAEREGAVVVQRERRSGDGSRLLRLTVAAPGLLAKHLGVQLLDARVTEAERYLGAWIVRFPVLAEVIATWHRGRKVRGCGPEAAQSVALAAKAVAARGDDAGHDRVLRRESVRLFNDSKQLEKLTPWLEILVTGELTSAGLAREEVWSAVGLRREPQPLLLAGVGAVTLVDATLPLVRPYLGLPMESIQGVATPARCLLTIENLASFHDAASVNGSGEVLLLYTGGMPSPAWRAAYTRILRALVPEAEVLHWGDVDEGGFRIAAVLSGVVRDVGRTLRPWRMSPEALPQDIVDAAAKPPDSTLQAMCRWATQSGWDDVARSLKNRPMQLEQEKLDPSVPLF